MSTADTPLKRQIGDELELNDYLTVILTRVGMPEYKVRHERLSHTSKRRLANDTELSSDPQRVKNGNEWLGVFHKSLLLPARATLPLSLPLLALVLSLRFNLSFD